MVSTDVIVESSATLIAGITFLVALRKTQHRPTESRFLKLVAGTLILFIVAAAAAVAEDLIPGEWHWPKVWTWAFFFLGLAVLAISIVYSLKPTLAPRSKAVIAELRDLIPVLKLTARQKAGLERKIADIEKLLE